MFILKGRQNFFNYSGHILYTNAISDIFDENLMRYLFLKWILSNQLWFKAKSSSVFLSDLSFACIFYLSFIIWKKMDSDSMVGWTPLYKTDDLWKVLVLWRHRPNLWLSGSFIATDVRMNRVRKMIKLTMEINVGSLLFTIFKMLDSTLICFPVWKDATVSDVFVFQSVEA